MTPLGVERSPCDVRFRPEAAGRERLLLVDEHASPRFERSGALDTSSMGRPPRLLSH